MNLKVKSKFQLDLSFKIDTLEAFKKLLLMLRDIFTYFLRPLLLQRFFVL